MKAIVNGSIITEQEILTQHAVIFNEKIRAVIPEEKLKEYPISKEINAAGNYISPGFIDVHVHGCNGFDTMDEGTHVLACMSKSLLQTGVTSFLPTTMTMPFPRIEQSFAQIRLAMGKTIGAEILGCHMEGPFISEVYKGAQDKQHILMPDFTKIAPHLDIIKIITIAPELADHTRFIQACAERGVIVSMGHSNATYEQAIEAVSAGVSHMTHTFNGLPPFNHRQPGPIGAALDRNVVCELIADNIHVHPAMQRLLLNVKGVDKILLITDAMRASLLGEGQYDLGGQMVIVAHGEARLPNGVIAGSVLTLNRAVKNFMENTGLGIVDAVKLVTSNPARQLGVLDNKGSIKAGKQADLVIFDETLEVFATIVRGNLLYNRL